MFYYKNIKQNTKRDDYEKKLKLKLMTKIKV